MQRIDAQSGHGVDLALDDVLVTAVDGAHGDDLPAFLPRGADGQLLLGGGLGRRVHTLALSTAWATVSRST